ncbi:MAG: hypothetical protein V1716_04530 [Candidatus Uhrbacteria bacterium]
MKNRILARLFVVLGLLALWFIAVPFVNKAMAQSPAPTTIISPEFLANCIKPELKSMFSTEKKAACSAALRTYADLLDEGVTSTASAAPSSSQGKKHTCTITGSDQLNLCLIAFGAMRDRQEPFLHDVIISGESGLFDGKVLIPDLTMIVDGRLCDINWLLKEVGLTPTKAQEAVASAASECVQP